MVLTQRHRRNSPKSEDASMSTNDARKRTQKRHTSYTLSVIALVVGPCLVMFSFQVPLELQDRHQEESRLRRIASLSSKIPQSREEQSRNGVVIARPSSSAAKEETAPPIPPPLKRVLTVYSEPPTTLVDHTPLERHTSASKLSKTEYPDFGTDCGYVHNFPIDDFVDTDPFLPWIHDYFVQDGHVKFVAQNKRRCETGEGKDIIMKFREPQMALFQPVSVKEERSQNGTILYKLSSPEEATYPETRFLCHFTDAQNKTYTTFSVYPFNYEYIHWRKRAMFKNTKAMFRFSGRDIEFFEFSQLLFSCPLPVEATDQPLWLDLVPIRTPARTKPLLTKRQVGSTEFAKLERFNTTLFYGDNHILPAVQDSGRWSNLPICARREQPPKQLKPQHRFVACTWTAASYHRRGDIAMVSDSEQRLTEWIVFHRLVGVDHIYLYDNSQGPETLRSVAERFSDFVTYIEWPGMYCVCTLSV